MKIKLVKCCYPQLSLFLVVSRAILDIHSRSGAKHEAELFFLSPLVRLKLPGTRCALLKRAVSTVFWPTRRLECERAMRRT